MIVAAVGVEKGRTQRVLLRRNFPEPMITYLCIHLLLNLVYFLVYFRSTHNSIRSRHGRIGASTAARMFFPRVCFPTHDAPSNFQDEPNVRVHDNDREYCRKGNAGGNTVIVVVWLFVKRV